MMDTKTFPIQSDYRDTKVHPTRIPWEVADKAYAVYRSRYGSQQSLERLAERGGFSGGEMDMFYPGWRDEVSGIAVRDARITELETALAAMTAERDAAIAELRNIAEADKPCSSLRCEFQEWARDRARAAVEHKETE